MGSSIHHFYPYHQRPVIQQLSKKKVLATFYKISYGYLQCCRAEVIFVKFHFRCFGQNCGSHPQNRDCLHFLGLITELQKIQGTSILRMATTAVTEISEKNVCGNNYSLSARKHNFNNRAICFYPAKSRLVTKEHLHQLPYTTPLPLQTSV